MRDSSEGGAAYGIASYKDDSSWLVDRSSIFTGALFVRITRTFAGHVALDELMGVLRADERDLLDLLELELA